MSCSATKLYWKSSSLDRGDGLESPKNNVKGPSKVTYWGDDSNTQKWTFHADLKGSRCGWKWYQSGKYSWTKTTIEENCEEWVIVWSWRETSSMGESTKLQEAGWSQEKKRKKEKERSTLHQKGCSLTYSQGGRRRLLQKNMFDMVMI